MKPEIEAALTAHREALARVRESYEALESLRSKCQHTMVPDDPEDPGASFPVCTECGHEGDGWWCPDNAPTHECVYDWALGGGCAHCGSPEERK